MSATFVDLHCHSTASDGTLPPAEVVRLAKRNNLSAMSLTDHDTVAGIDEAAREAEKLGIDFIAGIEISAEYPYPGTLHILGYGVDPTEESLKNLTATLLAGRDHRNPKIVAKLNEMGVSVSMKEWDDEAKGDVLGRPQLAAILHRKGYVSSIKQAFEKYIGQGAPAYFDKERLSPAVAIARIRSAGGLPVLAHPVQLRKQNSAQLETEIKNLVDLGMSGIEVIHSDHDAATVAMLNGLAERFKLLKTGGSDFHGSNKPNVELGMAGGRRIPREFFDQLRKAINNQHEAVKALEDMSLAVENLDLDAINPMLEKQQPEKIVEWAVATFGDEIVMSSSFGEQAAVLLHMATRVKPDIRIIFVDTGYLFPETYEFMESLRHRFNLNVWTFRTRNDPIAYLRKAGEENPEWRNDIKACCAANKNEPFSRAFQQISPRAWLRGTRRDQTPERKNFKFIEWDKRYSAFAISPILNWNSRDVWQYMKQHDLPYHPLVEKGYPSIGCNPLSCTRNVLPGEDPRSGRWAGSDKTECGINVTNSLDSANL